MIYKVFTDFYVAAILDSTSALTQWLITIPSSDKLNSFKIEPFHLEKYPFQLLEFEYDNKRLFMCARDDQEANNLQYMLDGMGPKLLTTYLITEDFYGDPKNPGEDYMGILSHHHEDEGEEVHSDDNN